MINSITIRFHAITPATFEVALSGPDIGEAKGTLTLPFDAATRRAIWRALTPNYRPDAPGNRATEALLADLGDRSRLAENVGRRLADALLTTPDVRTGFSTAISLATGERTPLPVEMRFGQDCDEVAALPWELLHYRDHFLVSGTTIVLSRYPEGAIPPTPVLADLPLRVLMVLSEPVDAGPTLSHQARRELVHGLRGLDEQGAVLVDVLRPPTFATLVEALTTGEYHMLVFYGHGVYREGQGHLLFEDEFGGPGLVSAGELANALRNSSVRVVVLGACESAALDGETPDGDGETALDIWSGTAPALVKAGVPVAIGMQVSMRVDAALAFLRQFALSVSAGKSVVDAVGDARRPLTASTYDHAWCIPAVYGRTRDGFRLFDPAQALPPETAQMRTAMQTARREIQTLEEAVSRSGSVKEAAELAGLRAAKARYAQAHAELAGHPPGGYALVTSPHYGVPSNRAFVGRQAEIVQVGRGLAQTQPVVVWGTGGIGKSALAVEVAHRQSWRYPGGVLWLACQGGPALDTLLDRMAGFCGIAQPDKMEPDKKATNVRAALANLDERVLMIWDNVEDVWDDRAIRQFIYDLPDNVQCLITTRHNPEETGWSVVELPRLPDPAMTRLFLDLGAKANIKLASRADADLIPAVVGWLQGHPLALILAVPLAAKHGMKRLWQELQREPLEGIDAALAASMRFLSPDEVRLFARLSVFTIRFKWEAAAALLPDVPRADRLLDRLVQQALVDFDGARHGYHALVRQYAYARLLAMEKDVRPIHRLAAEYLQAKITDPDQGGTPEEVLEHVDQWEQAAEWETFAHRASALINGLDRLGYWGKIDQRLERALVGLNNLQKADKLAATLWNDRGTMALKLAQWERAIGYYERSLEKKERMGDINGMAQTYMGLGNVYLQKGEWEQAIGYYKKDLEISERVGDVHGMAQTLGNLGNVYLQKGEWVRAIGYYEYSLEKKERVEDIHGMSQTYNNLGLVYTNKGEWERAIGYFERSLEISERVGDIHGMAQTYNNLGSVYVRKGEWERAIDYYEQSLETQERVGDIHGMSQTLGNLGLVFANKGEWERATGHFARSLEIDERVGDIHGMAQTYNNLGLVYTNKGEWERAIGHFARSLEIDERVGDIHGMATTYMNLGNVYRQKGEWERAISYYEQSLETKERQGDILGMAQIFGNLGLVFADKGEWERAIGYYERSLETEERVGDIHGMAQTYNNLGLVYADKGEWERAIGYHERSREALERVGDIHGMAKTFGNLGNVYQHKGEWERAISYYERSLETLEWVGDIHGMAQIFGNLGNVYQHKGEWERAIGYYERSLEILERVGDIHSMAQTYNNLGNVYTNSGEWERAIGYYERSLEIKERVGDIHGMAKTFSNLGNICLAKGEGERAIGYYERSLEILERVGDIYVMAQTFGNLGIVYADKGEWERAIGYYEQSLEAKERMGDIHGMAQTYGNLGHLYQAQGDTDQAARYVAQAYLFFAQMGAPEAQQIAGLLVNIIGSADAANAYLQRMADESTPQDPHP